jgi:hypothetical protein
MALQTQAQVAAVLLLLQLQNTTVATAVQA